MAKVRDPDRRAAVAASTRKENSELWVEPSLAGRDPYGLWVGRCVSCDLRAITDVEIEDKIPALREELHALQERVHRAEAGAAQARNKLERLRATYREDNGIDSASPLEKAVREGSATHHTAPGGRAFVVVEIQIPVDVYNRCRN